MIRQMKTSSQVSSHAPLWKQRDYILLVSGQSISSVGTKVSQLAFSLLVLALTGSPAQAGVAGALSFVPYVLLALPVGALLDRWNRKRVMIFSDMSRCLAMTSIAVALALRHLTIGHLYLVAVIDGTGLVLFNIAQVASLPQVVAEEHLPAAIAQNDGLGQISPILGSFLGGLLYSLRALLPFVVDAFSYLASTLSLCLIRSSFQRERKTKPRPVHREIGEGVVWFWQQPLLRFMALFDSGVVAVISAVSPLVVVILAQQQQASAVTIGLILAAGGVGGGLGILLAAHVHRSFRYAQIIIGLGWVWILLWLAYLVTPNPFFLGFIVLLIFGLIPPYSAVQVSYRLLMTPDAMQGRVNSVHRLCNYLCKTLGVLLVGVGIQQLGMNVTLLLFASWFVLLALAATFNRSVRQTR